MCSCLRSRRTACRSYTTGTCAESHAGADCGLPCASEHEDYAGIMCDFPKERVQNRFVDVLVPHQAGWFANYS